MPFRAWTWPCYCLTTA